MRHLFKVLLSFILILALIITIGSYLFIKRFDLNSYKSLIEKQAYQYTGRELKINGDARLGISLIPTLIVDDIVFANAPWAEQPEMVRINTLKIQISLLPLLKRQIVIDDIILINPHVFLEKAANGLPNWDFPTQTANRTVQTLGFAQLQEYDSVNVFNAQAPLPDYIQNISVKNISIEDGYIHFYDASTQKTHDLTINSLTFNMDSLDSPIKTQINAVYQNQPIKTKMILGSFNDLYTPQKPYNIDLDIETYNVKTLIKGTLLDVLNNISYNLAISATSPAGNFELPETSLRTDLQGTVTHINANIQKLSIANNQISGTLIIDTSKSIPQIKANLQSPALNLQTLKHKKTAHNFDLIKSAAASELIPNTPIPYDLLRLANGNIAFSIKKLIVDDAISAENVSLKATFNNGILNIKPLNFDFGEGNIDLIATVNANNRSLTAKINSQNILLQNLHKEFLISDHKDFGVLSGGKTFLTTTLNSQGNTLRQLVQNATGQIVAIASESKIQTGHLTFLTKGIIPQILQVLKVDTSKNNKVNMQCAVVRADIAGGKVSFPDGIAIQSDKMTLSSNGKVNLINDKIDFSLAPSFDLDAGISQAISSLVRITGTIDHPQIALDDKQALKTVVGIATTGGFGYIGYQTALSNNSPCYTALKGTSYQDMVPQPSKASKAQQEAITETKAALKETKTQVKKELKNLEKNAKEIINIFKGK